MKKNIFAILLIIFVITIVSTGCGSKEESITDEISVQTIADRELDSTIEEIVDLCNSTITQDNPDFSDVISKIYFSDLSNSEIVKSFLVQLEELEMINDSLEQEYPDEIPDPRVQVIVISGEIGTRDQENDYIRYCTNMHNGKMIVSNIVSFITEDYDSIDTEYMSYDDMASVLDLEYNLEREVRDYW